MQVYPKTSKFQNLQAVFFQLFDEETLPIKNEISFILNNIQNNYEEFKKYSHNNQLAGHIEHQYALSGQMDDYIKKLIFPAFKEYTNSFIPGASLTLENLKTKVENNPCWVNIQKKYEYNPMHRHGGTLSFVIWIKIPYLMENERKYPNVIKSKNSLNGEFCFIHQNNNLLHQIPLNADQTWENRGVVFSSELNHIVYPFYTSDEFRISISGNYRIE